MWIKIKHMLGVHINKMLLPFPMALFKHKQTPRHLHCMRMFVQYSSVAAMLLMIAIEWVRACFGGEWVSILCTTQCSATMKIEWAMRWWQTIIDFGISIRTNERTSQQEQAKGNHGIWLYMCVCLVLSCINYSISKHFNFVANGVLFLYFFLFFQWNEKQILNVECMKAKERKVKWHGYCLYLLVVTLKLTFFSHNFFRCSILIWQHFMYMCICELEDSQLPPLSAFPPPAIPTISKFKRCFFAYSSTRARALPF